ncbi:nuclear transport factor 2 family protein [Amycolatopsis magusensis]|uniref:nuclear transport factor 2 family protein n=1 Tax=Amycolatopsis magusensis TaxID=882444 RepID=UPI003C2D8185
MGTAENKELVEGIFAEMAAGNPRAMSDAMADDFRWIIPGAWSWSGTWPTKTATLTGLLRPLMAQFPGGYRSEADFVLADGNRVVVQARAQATTTAGESYHQTYCFVFTVEDGKLTEVIEHCDTALVERVLVNVTATS